MIINQLNREGEQFKDIQKVQLLSYKDFKFVRYLKVKRLVANC